MLVICSRLSGWGLTLRILADSWEIDKITESRGQWDTER